MTSQEPTSFREESDAPDTREAWEPTSIGKPPAPETPASGYYHVNTQRAMYAGMATMIGNRPEAGPAVEALIQRYPLMSRETVVGLVASDQINVVSPALMDKLAEYDQQQQKLAQQQAWYTKVYGGLKATTRHLAIGAEDLYNNQIFFTAPRTLINRNQGKSWSEAWDASTNSSAQNHILMSRLGFDVGYGEGLMPSQEIVPTDQYFFATVKELILNGEFEGSAEEQIIAASQEALYQQGAEMGFNPYAIAVEQWDSTHMSRTIGGVNYAVPYSPGRALALPFTTPGTRSFDTFSALVDGISRLTMEPIDVPFDEAGRMLRHAADPLVRGGMPGYRTRAHADLLHDVAGVEVALEPIKIQHFDGPVVTTTEAKGATFPKVEDDGGFRVLVDPDRTDDHFDLRMDEMHKDDVWDLEGEYAVYTQPYEDMGVTPSQVRNELSARGGRQAEFYLTVEHELHHVDQNKRWFGNSIGPDGQRYVDYAKVTDEAPEEVKQLVSQLTYESNSVDTIQKMVDEHKGLNQQLDGMIDEVKELRRQIDTKEIDTPEGRKQARRDANDIEAQQEAVGREIVTKRAEYDEAMAVYNTALEELQNFTEATAIKTAWKNMLDGSWTAEELMKKYKRKLGLSKLMRPYVNPISVNDWLKSRLGKRTLSNLSRTDNIQTLRKRMPYIEGKDLVRIADTSDEAVIQKIIQDAFEGNKTSMIQRPTVGMFTDTMTRGLDAWQQSSQFIGGPVGKAMTSMGRYGARMKTSVGNVLLSQTNLDQTLDTINSVLATAGATRDDINKVQRMAILGHGRHTTIDALYDQLQEITTNRLLEQAGDLYSKAEVTGMWDDWRGYEIVNRHYWTSNAGKDRNWIYQNGRFKSLSDLEAKNVKPEAFMEAQFSQTNRSVPSIRSFRRLYSQQRRAYEKAMQWKANVPVGKGTWDPQGFAPTGIMDFGDWSFGLWRDMQLLRGGWAMRIIPEEQLRFGASGMSNIFRHPLDYFISMMNPMDFTLHGDNMTLGNVLKKQESLGTGSLRDYRYPPHMVRTDDWDVANRLQHPRPFWGGLTREYITSSSDPVVSRVARMGQEEAIKFFKSDEGKLVLQEIANEATVGGSLARIIRPDELQSYTDVVDLRIAQITGGDGLWHNPETGQWVDSMDQAVPKASDRIAYPNEDTLHLAMLDAAGGDPEVLVGMTHRSRADLEAALNELRGYNLDELEETGRAAVVTRQGDDDWRRFLGDRELDDMKIDNDMPYDETRKLDEKLEEAFNSREVEPPENWPVAKGELDDPNQASFRNRATDGFFHWFNAIPSNVLNRQPYFQQQFGRKMAEAYYYGDSGMRTAIDEFASMNESFKITFDVGQRQVFRDLRANKWPEPFDAIKRRPETQFVDPSETPMAVYEEAVQRGSYDRVPLQGDPEGFVTEALMRSMQREGYIEGEATRMRGMYAQRYGRSEQDYAGFPGHVYSSTKTHVPLRDWAETRRQYRAMYQKVNAEAYGIHVDVYDNLVRNPNPVRENEIMRHIDPIVHDKFVAEIEAERILHRDIMGEVFTDEVLEEAAMTLGWGRDKRSGGVALGPKRAGKEYYGDYTDVFLTESFGPELQKIMREEGDLEQLYFIDDKRTPNLAAMDEDIIRVWNDVRERTMFKQTIGTYRELHQDNPKILAWFDKIEDDITDILPAPSQVELENPAFRDVERYDALQQYIDDEIAAEGDKWLHEFTSFYNEVFGRPNMGSNVKVYAGIDLRRLLNLFDDPMMEGTKSFTTSMDQGTAIKRLLELEMGRDFTVPEWDELLQNFRERLSYLPSEIVLHNQPIEAAGRFPRETLQNMVNNLNISVESPREMGHMALLLDQNTEPIGPFKAPRTAPTPFHTTYRPHLPSRAKTVLDEGQMWDQWQNFTWEGVDMDFMLDVQHVVNNLEIDGHLIIDDPITGPRANYDYPLWVASDQFQKFVESAEATAKNSSKQLKLFFQNQAAGPGLPGARSMSPKALLNSSQFRRNVETLVELEEASALVHAGSLDVKKPHLDPRPYDEMIEDAMDAYAHAPGSMMVTSEDVSRQLTEDLKAYHEGATMLDMATDRKLFAADDADPLSGYKLGKRRPTEEALRGEIKVNFDGVPQNERNAATQRIFNAPDDGVMYDRMEAGSPSTYKDASPQSVNDLEQLMKAAKRDSIDETKDLFYDLTNKSNVADAMKFIFPFGDAWYEVLSRWAKIQNPLISGGQSFRNVRRIQQTWQAGQSSGFISTNEYGEEVFNWPLTFGSLINSFIPNEANVSMQGKVPISSLMFIDPSARGIGAPGTSPLVQLTAQLTQPDTTNIPFFSDAMSWLAYGSKDEYRPAEIDDVADVAQGFLPTVYNRLVSAAFDEQARETMGNTKLRLFESIGISGDPEYNIMANPANAAKVWDLADKAGSWLGWLRILDSWWMPGQPQFTPVMEFDAAEVPGQAMTMTELVAESAKLSPETQFRIENIVRASNEYRLVRDNFGDAEADMYMIERYGILPSMLQSASVGLVDRPTTWGGVQHLHDNDWLYDAAPLTLAWTVPPDADPTFSSAAWNGLFSEHLELEGVENQPIRRAKSPSEILQSIQRGMGYDQVRHQNSQYDAALEKLRAQYNQDYQDPGYRAEKNELDRLLRNNIEGIYTEFPIVRPSQQGSVVGAPQSVPTRRYVDEIISIGTIGTEANSQFRREMPELADVAEEYAVWFTKMEAFSRLQDSGEATGEWWMNSEAPNAQIIRAALASQVESYYRSLESGSHAEEYANRLNQRLFDPLLKDWEWIDSAWSFEAESFPSIDFANKFVQEETP